MSDPSKSGGDKQPETNETKAGGGDAGANTPQGAGATGAGGGTSDDSSKANTSKADSSKSDGSRNQPRQNAARNDSNSDPSKSGGDKQPEEPVRRGYHVVGPGSVTFDGKMYAARKRIDLTDEEAEGLAGQVKLGPPPKIEKPEDVASRGAGKYKVAGPGTVWHDGKPRQPGYEFQADAEEARSLGASISPV
jgi:hypothetical protein